MTPPNVQFIPAAAAGGTWDISGSFDATFGSGGRDDDPNFVLPSSPFSGLQYIAARQDASIGLAFVFNTQSNRDAFVAAYPDNFGLVTYQDTLNNVAVTTISGWVWDTSISTRAYLKTTEWTNWQTVSLLLVGQTYTLEA